MNQADGERASGEVSVDTVVMKFGGTSLEDPAAVRRAIQLVEGSPNRPVVVASALARVTDQLLEAATVAAQGRLPLAVESVQQLEQRHLAVARELVDNPTYTSLERALGRDFALLGELARTLASSGELSARLQDHFLGVGESLASKIVQAALSAAGRDAAWVDAWASIVTDAAHTQATPLWEETNQRLRSRILPLLAAGKIPVMGGFIGATRDGVPTTLGRGGSDFSAAILGAALNARRIEIWTDVDGILTADPKLCPDARRVPRLSFEEAADLAYFGAKVLHPSTIVPAMRQNIPVVVRNSRNPQGPGTEIAAQPNEPWVVKAVTAKPGVAVVDVEAVRWLAPELLREVFEVLEHHRYRPDLLSASRGSLTLLVESTESLPAVAEQLHGLANVRWQNHRALVSLVGEKVRRQPEIASQVFGALADVDLRMICQGASERCISFLVEEARAEEVVRRLHRLFFQSRFERYSSGSVAQTLCSAGSSWQ
ncbi:MAG TPA: aspartate kinase [Terriglobales bacterium]|nr:aspartate kinase [Terriglobales bacterium]